MTPTPAPVRVVLDAAALRALARRPEARKEFPGLTPFSRPVPAGCCGKPGTGPDPRQLLESLARLGPARVKVLKTLLGADVVVVWVVRAGRGTKVEL